VIALDMGSATIAANGFRFRVHTDEVRTLWPQKRSARSR
jgi:nucleoside phosphorylase